MDVNDSPTEKRVWLPISAGMINQYDQLNDC